MNKVSPAKFIDIEDSYDSVDGSSDVSAILMKGIAPHDKQIQFAIIGNRYIWSVKRICSYYFNLPRPTCFM